MYSRHALQPTIAADVWRGQIPIYDGQNQMGRATSGTWSPILKKNLAIGTVEARFASNEAGLSLEWSVEGERGRIGALVRSLPFFDPPRKRE